MINFLRQLVTRKNRSLTSADLEALLAATAESGAGVSVSPASAMRLATVYACVRLLADSIAQLPLKLYRHVPSGGREVLSDDPLANILSHQPNGWMTSFELREIMMACLCLRGNFYAYIARDTKGRVTELFPLQPGDVNPRLLETQIVYDASIGGLRQTVAAENIFHVRGLSHDGVIGLSPITLQRNAIGLAIATEAHGSKVFKNGARPGGVLSHPGKLSDDALRHLKDSWQQAHGGDNSGGTAILEEGMDYKSVAMTNQDAQYLEARGFQRTEICSIFRVPPHMIGDLTKSSFSNITQQSLEFVKYTILPWSRRIEAAIRRDLLTEEQRADGVYAEFLVDGLERADIQTRYTAYKEGVINGWLSPNEIRAKENMNPREGGDVFLMPLNMTDGTKPPQPPPPPAKALPEPITKSAEPENTFWSAEVSGINEAVQIGRGQILSFMGEMVRRECEMVRRLVNSNFAKKADHPFDRQLETELEKFAKPLASGLTRILKTYAYSVGLQALRKVPNTADLSDDLEQWATGYAAILAEQHVASTAGQIGALVRNIPQDELAATILRRVDEWESTRAAKVANDEAVRFANGASRELWRQRGITKLRYVNQGSRVCPFCKELDGKVVGIEEAFLGDGEVLYAQDGSNNWMAMKGQKLYPPIHQGCVCAIVPEYSVEDIPNE